MLHYCPLGGGLGSLLSISSCPVRAAAGGRLSSLDLRFQAHRASKGENGTRWAVRDVGDPLVKKDMWSCLALFARWVLGAEASSTPGRAEPQGRRSLGSRLPRSCLIRQRVCKKLKRLDSAHASSLRHRTSLPSGPERPPRPGEGRRGTGAKIWPNQQAPPPPPNLTEALDVRFRK